jgi:hypothetical protein
VRYAGAYAGGADSAGYLNSARLLSEGRVSTPMRALPELPPGPTTSELYMPLGFVTTGTDRLASAYPIGLPALIAAASYAVGWDAAAFWTRSCCTRLPAWR